MENVGQELAAAILVRYAEPGDRPELDRKYAEAMQRVAQSFPHDPDIATLAAESLMLLSPWDYARRRAHGEGTYASSVEATRKCTRHARPTSPAIHFYIRLVEASDRPQRADRRLICVTGFGAGDSRGRGGILYNAAFCRFVGRIYADKDVQERITRRNRLDWTIVRPF